MSMRLAVALGGFLALAIAQASEAGPAIPSRTPLATVQLMPGKLVSHVETTRVDFQPAQSMPAHLHTVPVICFVTKGDFLVRIGDDPERRAPLGSVTYEPAGATVRYFKNASASEPAQLQCASLAGPDDTVLNHMLDDPPGR